MATIFEQLRDLAQHIDPQFHPSLNELPGFVAALVVKLEHGEAFLDAIEQGQQAQADLHPSQIAGNEVRAHVAEVIQPEKGDNVAVQGVPQQHYDALKAEVEQLRAQFERLADRTAPPADAPTEPAGVAAPAPTASLSRVEAPADASPSQRELELEAEIEQLRFEQAQRTSLAQAGEGHPTVSSQPEPAVGEPAVPPVADTGQSQAGSGQAGTSEPPA